MRAFFAVILAASTAAAQSVVTARAGMIYMVEGPATLDGQPIRIQNRMAPRQIEHGQIVASPHGHAELLMGQDAVLWTGADAQLRLDDSNVDAPRVSLLAGSAMLEIKNTRAQRRIFIDLGNQTAEVASAGIYRFDRSPDRVRAWSGAATLQGPPGALNAGQMSLDGRRQNFDKRDMDELHYFAAYRSLVLEDESGRLQRWKFKMSGDYSHAGFDLALPLPAAAARAMYLAASEAGLIHHIESGSTANRRTPNTPFRAGRTVLETNNDRVEVFLGLGITARLNNHTRLRILDTKASTPDVRLESGEVMVEVAKAAESVLLNFRMGDSLTELHKPGLYRFHEASSSLYVYSGESLTHFGDSPVRATRGQRLDVYSPQAAKRAGDRDAFFQWNSRRSLEVYASDASFMADWEPQVSPGRVKHKVFGEQASLRRESPRRGLPPVPSPLTQALPPISQDPRGNEPGSAQIK